MHVHLDLLGGIAGDMFISAMLDVRPDLTDGALAVADRLGLSNRVRTECTTCTVGGLTGRRFAVTEIEDSHTKHHHTTFRSIREMIAASPLEAPEKARAVEIFRFLANAEARVHGVDVDDVHFHEVGAFDSIVDIVTSAWIIEALGPCSWSVSAIPTGSGRTRCQHGIIPVPAPATALLLEGMELVDDGIPGERVTPTGAAILRQLEPETAGPSHPMRLLGSGTGFGTATLPGVPNIVRALQYDTSQGTVADRVASITFEVDDQTPEDLATGLDIMRDLEDVVDIFVTPVLGKKNRQAQHVTILAALGAEEAVVREAFVQTTTLGLRIHHCSRRTLPRQMRRVGETRVKIADRPGGATAKVEADDLKQGASTARSRAKRAIEATDAALQLEGDSG